MLNRFARIYLAPGKPAIFAGGEDRGGVSCEELKPVGVTEWDSGGSIALALRAALGRFKRIERDLREAKKTDWPAFQVSGLRSVDAFEKAYLCITVSAFNEAELFYRASVLPRGESEIALSVGLGRYEDDSAYGEKILRLYAAAMLWPDTMGTRLEKE